MTTLSLEERKREHYKKFRLNLRDQAFYAALHKYGWDSFVWEEIAKAPSRNELIQLEQNYIAQYQSNKKEFGYNLTSGGDGVINGEYQTYFRVRFPDGHEEIVKGWKAFCRQYKLNEGCLHNTLFPYLQTYRKKNGEISVYKKTSNHHKGFKLLERFNDYPGGEYTQASGSASQPESQQVDDIVSTT